MLQDRTGSKQWPSAGAQFLGRSAALWCWWRLVLQAVVVLLEQIFLDQFQVVGLKHLVAAEASHIIDAVAAHQELGLIMLAARHMQVKPILGKALILSSPQLH